jgi:hypothetical protein
MPAPPAFCYDLPQRLSLVLGVMAVPLLSAFRLLYTGSFFLSSYSVWDRFAAFMCAATVKLGCAMPLCLFFISAF